MAQLNTVLNALKFKTCFYYFAERSVMLFRAYANTSPPPLLCVINFLCNTFISCFAVCFLLPPHSSTKTCLCLIWKKRVSGKKSIKSFSASNIWCSCVSPVIYADNLFLAHAPRAQFFCCHSKHWVSDLFVDFVKPVYNVANVIKTDVFTHQRTKLSCQ